LLKIFTNRRAFESAPENQSERQIDANYHKSKNPGNLCEFASIRGAHLSISKSCDWLKGGIYFGASSFLKPPRRNFFAPVFRRVI